MAKPNLSLSDYLLLDLVPVFFVFLVIIIFFLILAGMIVCLFCNHPNTAKSLGKLIVSSLIKLTMAVFGPHGGGNVLNHEKNQTKKDKKDEYDAKNLPIFYINNEKVHWIYRLMFGAYVIGFILFSATVFWDVFLLEESNNCDDTTIDCFAQVADNDSSFSPVKDCSVYEDYGSNVTFICYTFVYSFGPALAAMGGLLTMIKIVMKIISVVFLSLYGYACSKKKLCLLILFQIFLVLLISIALPIVLIILVVDLPSLSAVNITQIALVMLTLFMGFSIPWGMFVK